MKQMDLQSRSHAMLRTKLYTAACRNLNETITTTTTLASHVTHKNFFTAVCRSVDKTNAATHTLPSLLHIKLLAVVCWRVNETNAATATLLSHATH